MEIRKLNFGCGTRIAPGWTNIDFYSFSPQVQRVNLLGGFPFPDNSFDCVYSSHVIEHFTREQSIQLLRESHRVLKPGGVVRTVVPDLEATVREYVRILALPDSGAEKPKYYEWITIELLDQMVRTSPGGAMGKYFDSVVASGDSKMIEYVRSRTESDSLQPSPNGQPRSLGQKLKSITPAKVSQHLAHRYLDAVKMLIPQSLRSMVVNETSMGEKHRWMYDRYGMKLLNKEAGFSEISFPAFNESSIPGFVEDRLDSNADETPYKNGSLYCEAKK